MIQGKTSLRRSRIKPSRKAAQRRRAELKVVQVVRPIVEARDGYCRWAGRAVQLGRCHGESQWAHAPWLTRAKTRRMDPTHRHTSAGSLMACQKHHDEMDGRALIRMSVEPLTPKGTDGPLRARRLDMVYEEPA